MHNSIYVMKVRNLGVISVMAKCVTILVMNEF